jgi:hypothetical protein
MGNRCVMSVQHTCELFTLDSELVLITNPNNKTSTTPRQVGPIRHRNIKQADIAPDYAFKDGKFRQSFLIDLHDDQDYMLSVLVVDICNTRHLCRCGVGHNHTDKLYSIRKATSVNRDDKLNVVFTSTVII